MAQRREAKWHATPLAPGQGGVLLVEYVDLATSSFDVALWLEAFTRLAPHSMTLYPDNDVPLKVPAPAYVAERESGGASSHTFLLAALLTTDPETEVGLAIVVTSIATEAVRVLLFSEATTAQEAVFFFYVRDHIRDGLPGSPTADGKDSRRGHPHLLPPEARCRIVQEWRQKKAVRWTKKNFAATVQIPGNVMPGIDTKTLSRWEKECPEE